MQLLPTTPPRQAQSPSVAAQVLAGAEYVPDRLLVRFRDPVAAPPRALIHADVGATVVKTYDAINNLQLVRLVPGSDVGQAIEQYRSRPDVLYAEPDWIVHAIDTIPDDPDFDDLWGLHNTGQSDGTADADIDAPAAWDLGTGSSDVIVVVIDTGVDYNHEDLAGNMFKNTPDCNTNGVDDDGNGFVDDCYGIDTVNDDSDPMDDDDHGTHVSGTIGAVGNNTVGVTGVNWDVSIMGCKFLDSNGSGSTSDAIDCFGYIDTMYDAGHTNIVASSNSWGGGGFSQALADAIDSNRERGILAIAAAGNVGTDNDLFPNYPSNYFLPNIIAVAATDRNEGIASFSQFGSTSVHIGAPGVAILSTTRNDTYKSFNGTSMATPHVAGVAALMRAQNPSWDWLDIKNRILAGGDNTSAMSDKTVTGKRLNAYGSLTCSNSVVNARLQPLTDTVLRLPGSTVNLASLHINCGDPNGSVSVSVSSSEGNSTIDLEDDGLGDDQVAGDGIYSGTYTASTATDQSLTFPGGDVVDIPQTRPNTPTSLTVTPASRTEINVSWLDNSSDETNFHLERAPGSTGSWSTIAFQTASSYLDTGLTCNATYDYRVRAHRHGDNSFSDYSNTATATTQDCVELLSINDVAVQEGDAGTSTALFTVSLSVPASETVQVDYATVDGSADAAGATTHSNPATITVPSSGEADPYPSTIVVPDAVTSASKVTVTLLNFSHVFPRDVDILLVGPGGNVLLMSDVGGSSDVSNLTLTFDDSGGSVPNPLVSGTYSPTNVGDGDAFPAPAPADPYGALLSVFNGTDPSGTWALYVVDDLVLFSGSILDGWKLTLEGTGDGDYIATSGTLTFPPGTTSQPIAVTINGDTVIEQHETFFVNLTNETNASIADGQATGFILSDDFVPRLLTVSKTGTGTGTVTSDFPGIDCGNDCQASFPSGQLVTLTPTAASGSLFRGWSGDADCSDGIVTMSGPRTCTATFTLIGALQFSSAAYSVTEPGGSALVTITRTDGSAGAVAVTFATSDGTATAGSDYTATTVTVSWADGETSVKTASVGILDDAVLEADETVHLTLSTPTGGATLGTPSEADLTILDDGAVIGLGPGGGGWMDEVNLAPPHTRRDWFGVPWSAYNTDNGETRPVFCNLDGEGSHELVVGLGPGGGGWVEVRAGLDGNFAHQEWTGVPFSMYNTANGETRPACGDLDGDGRDEIVIGLGPGARGILEIRDDALANFAHLAWIQVPWAAYDTANGETFPAVGDLDGDGRAEIVIGLGKYTANGGMGGGARRRGRWLRSPEVDQGPLPCL